MSKLIKSEEQYNSALNRADQIFDSKPGDANFEELELLMVLIEHYEKEKFPIEDPDPIEAIKFRMEQLGMKRVDLGRILGSKSRASEILNRQRKLTVSMIRKLNKELGIPAEVLIAE
jgi:HTH-type transcriptional regulator/antitoxin HigA